MSEQSTQPAPRNVGEQLPAILALAGLAERFPGLAPGYMTVSASGAIVTLQLQQPHEFESWRVALGVAAQDVALHTYKGSVWLDMTTAIGGVRLEVTGYGLPVAPDVAAVTPQADADCRYRSGQLVEQRHQVEDPAEPPLAVRVPEGRPLADLPGGAA